MVQTILKFFFGHFLYWCFEIFRLGLLLSIVYSNVCSLFGYYVLFLVPSWFPLLPLMMFLFNDSANHSLCCKKTLSKIFTPKSRQSLRFSLESSTQLGVTSSAQQFVMKLWYSACTSGSCSLSNLRLAAVKRGFSFVWVWILNLTRSMC